MGVTLSKAGKDVYDLLESLIIGYYPDLQEVQLKIGALFVHPADVDKPPLKGPGGHPVEADIKVTNYESRVGGMPDVRIKLCAQAWANFNEQEKLCTLDKQLYRLEVQREKLKKPKPGQPGPSGPPAVLTDDLGRPKLRLRKYDHMICCFDAMVRRHGEAALDAREVDELSAHLRSLGS